MRLKEIDKKILTAEDIFEADGKNTHLDHAEEIVFIKGEAGSERSYQHILRIAKHTRRQRRSKCNNQSGMVHLQYLPAKIQKMENSL